MLDKNMNKAHLTPGEPEEIAVFIVEARIPELRQTDSSSERIETRPSRWQIPERHQEALAARRAATQERAAHRRASSELRSENDPSLKLEGGQSWL